MPLKRRPKPTTRPKVNAVDDQVKLAFASATELTKQLITLGTAVLTLQASFSKSFFANAVDRHWQGKASWVFLLLSVIAGIWALMAITGTLAGKVAPDQTALMNTNIRIPSAVQVLCFVIGMAMSIWFGFLVA